MKKIGLIYGSSTGNTENIVQRLSNILGVNNTELKEISQINVEEISSYDKLILASSTWGQGDLQSDWENFETQLDNVDFKNKTVALIGLDEQQRFRDPFCEALSLLYSKTKKANIIGHTSTVGYNFQASKSVVNGEFVGLALDEDNQDELTTKRLEEWVKKIKEPLGI